MRSSILCFPQLRTPSKLQLSQHVLARRQIRSMMQEPLEEQTLPGFVEKRYYPVRIGQLFNSRYRILAKLGYGAYSTVWLARDERTSQYKSVKACICKDKKALHVMNEIKILRHLAACSQEHGGSTVARLADDIFGIDGHSFIVMAPQGCSIKKLQQMFPDSRLPKELIKATAMRLIACINWLQLDCGVIHTEITPQNILMKAYDETAFRNAENEESANPSTPFIDYTHPNPHPIHTSRGLPQNLLEVSGGSILTDFGSARLGSALENRDWWMPDTYRAPEVLMGLPWDYQVDIWSIGVMVLELLEGKNLFNPIDSAHNQYVLPLALAQYIGYMGLPPLWMIQQSGNPVMSTFFDEQGKWIGDVPIHITSFENFVTAIPPGDEKSQFLKFLRKIFTWDPAERALSSDLFEDEWLTTSFKASGVL